MFTPQNIVSNTNIFVSKLNGQNAEIVENAFEYQFKRIHSLDRFGYIVKKFSLLETEYGMRVAVFFDGFYIHLPKRIGSRITRQHEMKYLNDLVTRTDMMFKFGGYDENGKMKIKFTVNASEDDINNDDADFFDE